jgi:hypothetical protein
LCSLYTWNIVTRTVRQGRRQPRSNGRKDEENKRSSPKDDSHPGVNAMMGRNAGAPIKKAAVTYPGRSCKKRPFVFSNWLANGRSELSIKCSPTWWHLLHSGFTDARTLPATGGCPTPCRWPDGSAAASTISHYFIKMLTANQCDALRAEAENDASA